jgi:hypothetical protein
MAGLERRPSMEAPDLNAPPEAIQAFLQQRPADPLSYLSPEERALYDKYYGSAKRIANSPEAFDPTTSRIFLDTSDLRSMYAPFDPSKAGEVGLWKAEGGPVEKAEGGPIFDPNKISSMADELVNPYYEFEPLDPEAGDAQYMAGGGLARQWLKDAVENEVKRFQQTTAGGMDPQQALQQLQQSMQEADFQALPEGTRNAFQRSQEDLQRKAALNAWLGGTATKYIKRDYGTEQDPLTQLQMRHAEGEWPPRAAQGVLGRPPQVMGLYETTASRYTDPRAYGDSLRYNEEVLQSNPWLRNLPADQPIYRAVDVDALGMPHLVDEIQNAMNPSAGLPRNLQIRPESLQRMSFPQASELVGKINQYRAEQMAAANAQRATNPATQMVKQYPEGYRWVQITPDADIPEGWQRLNSGDYRMPDGTITSRGWAERAVGDALKYEGDTMGHCVGGYCDSVMSGASRIYSLRDAQGMPHVTIEAVPEFHPEEADFDEYWNALKPRLREQGEIPDRNKWFDMYLESTSDFAEEAAKLLGNRQRIIQIKGKGNRAPVDQYVPFVQDFVRSQDWIDVQELNNARLRDATREFSGRPQPQQRYMTDAEYDDYLLQLLRDEQAPGMKEGGEVKDDDYSSVKDALASLEAAASRAYGPQSEFGLPNLMMGMRAMQASTMNSLRPRRLRDEAGEAYGLPVPGLVHGALGLPALAYQLMGGDPESEALAGSMASLMEYGQGAEDMRRKYGVMGDSVPVTIGEIAGEMISQPPVIRAARAMSPGRQMLESIPEYIVPVVEPRASNYIAGTLGGVALNEGLMPLLAEEEAARMTYEDLMEMLRRNTEVTPSPERVAAAMRRGAPRPAAERLAYRPPAFPGMAEGGPVFDSDRINSMAMELMEPQKLAPGGLARAVKGAAKAGKLSNVEAGRIARAVEDETRSRGPINEAAAFEASMRPLTAAERAEAGRRAAAWIKTQEQIKASEALGQLMEQGFRRTTTTQADRTRVGGGNIGGAAFPAIGVVNPSYAGKAWGVMDQGTASRLTNLTTPDTAWTTMLGSATQLKTNPIVFDKLKRGFLSAMKEGKLTPELAAKINHNLALEFGEGIDIRDPNIWDLADTFHRRSVLADAMMGRGVAPSEGGVSLGGEKSGRGVIFNPSEILMRETERALLHPEHGGDVPTFAMGPRMFSLGTEVDYRPDLHPGFPTLIQGRDLGVNVMPTPAEVYLPDWHQEYRALKKKSPTAYARTYGIKGRGLPSQALTDEYIRHLIREGYAKGGLATYKDMIGA